VARLPWVEPVPLAAASAPRQPGSLVVTVLQRQGGPQGANPRANVVVAEGRVPLAALLKPAACCAGSRAHAALHKAPLVLWVVAAPAGGAAAGWSSEQPSGGAARIEVELELIAMADADDDARGANDVDAYENGSDESGGEEPSAVLAPAARAEVRAAIRDALCWRRGTWWPSSSDGDDGGGGDDDDDAAAAAAGAATAAAAAGEKAKPEPVFPTAASLRASLTSAGMNRTDRSATSK
jgi:hypothetical protein